jgi:hypothetical protein
VYDFVAEELLGGGGIDVGDGDPIASVIPDSSRSETMCMCMWTDRVAKRLWDGDDAGTSARVADGFTHQLLNGLVSESGEISQKFSVVHKVGTKHFWDRKCPKAMADIFEKLVLEKSGKCGGAFCIARRAESANFA